MKYDMDTSQFVNDLMKSISNILYISCQGVSVCCPCVCNICVYIYMQDI